MAGGLLGFWNDWASQIGVLLSLFFQVVLHILANIRRRKGGSYWLRSPLWVAYQLSDSTATYAAGQLLFNDATKDHHLIAFWVPFLLLHLGGPDNITAYALEDSKLWGRHLLSLLLQFLVAGYVLYKHIIGSGTLLMVAAILISVIGAAKYAERTWALRSAKFSNLQSSLKVRAQDMHHQQFYTEYQDWYNDGDLVLQHAHSLFHICKRGIVDCVITVDDPDSQNEVDSLESKIIQGLLEDPERMWRVMDVE